jgi:uncharacterized protein YdaU (DUF1376 family)
MHYYQFNIGDYASHTRHLDLLEDLAYRRLLDLYYLHERPLSNDASVVAKQIGMRDHAALVRDVLNEFFEHSQEGYASSRADKEIAHFHSKIEQASRAGKASAERRNNARPTDVQPNNKQEPITNKQETKKESATVVATPEGVTESVWQDFVKHRKAKKAPISPTALAGIKREADKASWSLDRAITECVERGWTGFKAEWVVPKQTFAQQAADIARTTVPAQHTGPDPVLLKIQADRQKAVPMPDSIRQQISQVLRKV